MPGKMARSDPRPSVRVTRGVGSGQHLASVLRQGRENANIDAGLGFIWRISDEMDTGGSAGAHDPLGNAVWHQAGPALSQICRIVCGRGLRGSADERLVRDLVLLSGSQSGTHSYPARAGGGGG